MRALLAAALVLPLCAHAASEQTLAVHPLAVVGVSPTEAEELSTSFASELAKLDLDLADGAQVRSFLEKKGGSCGGDDACLAELAKSTGSTNALWVTFAPFSPKMVVSAKVIRPDGSTARSVLGLEFEKASKNPTQHDVRGAFKKLFETLRLTSPELVSLVDPPNPPNTAVEPPTTSNTAVTRGRGTQSIIGSSLAAGGLGGLALAGIFGVQAYNSWATFNGIYDSGRFPEVQRAELLTWKDRAESQQRTAQIATVVGVAMAGAGVALFLTDTPKTTTAALTLTPNGIAAAGTF